MSRLAVATRENACHHRSVSFSRLPPTRRGLVERAAHGSGEEARAALAEVLTDYRGTVFKFYRSWLRADERPHAEDYTQGFLATLLTGKPFATFDWSCQFRWLLRRMAINYALKQREGKEAEKRGGLVEHESTDDRLERGFQLNDPTADQHFGDGFDVHFALVTRERALRQLERELSPTRLELLPRFRRYLHNLEAPEDYRALAAELSKSETFLKKELSTMRGHFRRLFSYALMLDGRGTFDDAVKEEVAYLLGLLSKAGL